MSSLHGLKGRADSPALFRVLFALLPEVRLEVFNHVAQFFCSQVFQVGLARLLHYLLKVFDVSDSLGHEIETGVVELEFFGHANKVDLAGLVLTAEQLHHGLGVACRQVDSCLGARGQEAGL